MNNAIDLEEWEVETPCKRNIVNEDDFWGDWDDATGDTMSEWDDNSSMEKWDEPG